MSNVDNALRFSAALKRFEAREYPALALQISADFAFEAIRQLVYNTPVRTGHMRHNWQAAFFGPSADELPGVDPGGLSTIAREQQKVKNLRAFQNVFFSNPVPYSIPIEEGSSSQAPAGVVAVTILNLELRARQIGARAAAKWKATQT